MASTQQFEAGAVAAPGTEVGDEPLDFNDLPTRFKGRIRRFTFFWLSALNFALAYFAAWMLTPTTVRGELVFLQPWWVFVVFGLGLVISAWTFYGPLTVLRLHDMNLSGGWAFLPPLLPLIAFLPVLFASKPAEYGSGMVDAITLLCWLALVLAPGSRGPNRFGCNHYKIL
jgi:uncharacterized membrane protein YhaH (DUF805 family)